MRWGTGTLFLKDGSKYLGHWYRDRMDGTGKFFDINGEVEDREYDWLRKRIK